MAVRPPQSLFPTGLKPETGWSVLDYELHEQKAQALGDLGTQVEQALTALRVFDDGAHAPDREDHRSNLLDQAADRVWSFMVQRELCGLRHWDAVVKDYRIPSEVLSRLGQVKRKRG
jgi:hypothetical protein